MLGSRVPGIQWELFWHVLSSCTSSQFRRICRLGSTTASIHQGLKLWYQRRWWPSFQSGQCCGKLPGLSLHPGPLGTCLGSGLSLFHTAHRPPRILSSPLQLWLSLGRRLREETLRSGRNQSLGSPCLGASPCKAGMRTVCQLPRAIDANRKMFLEAARQPLRVALWWSVLSTGFFNFFFFFNFLNQ